MKTIILPGLHGSEELSDYFVAKSPSYFDTRCLSLPDEKFTNYTQLADRLSPNIQGQGSSIIIAESFSGPLGILLAQRHPRVVKHLVLVATFATSPLPPFARFLPWSILFRIPLSRIISRTLIGKHQDLHQGLRIAVGTQSKTTLANRISILSQVNVLQELSNLKCPITYLSANSDRLVSRVHGEEIARANPLVDIINIEGPHLLLQANPKECWRKIEDAVNSNAISIPDPCGYPQVSAMKSIFAKLGIDYSTRYEAIDQDFEYTSCRLEELDAYVQIYKKKDTTDQEKRLLGCYFLQCLNDFLVENSQSHTIQSQVFQILHDDIEIHRSELDYWSDKSSSSWWAITKEIHAWRKNLNST